MLIASRITVFSIEKSDYGKSVAVGDGGDHAKRSNFFHAGMNSAPRIGGGWRNMVQICPTPSCRANIGYAANSGD